MNKAAKEADLDIDGSVVAGLATSAGGTVNPVCAFIGGVVSQEIVKAITGKFSPI